MTTPWIRVSRAAGTPPDGDISWSGGHRLPHDHDGIYAGWRWVDGRLTLETDRYGFYPLFAYHDSESWVCSPDLTTLLALTAAPVLDMDALAVFLRIGFFVGDDTPFSAIRALPPRPVLGWSNPAAPARWDGREGPSVTGVWPERRHLTITREAAVDGLIDLVRAAIRRRPADGPYVLPLSGGRDSRHLLLALVEAGCPPQSCVTVRHFPPRGNDDEAVAGALCRALGLEHRIILQTRSRAEVEREKNRLTHFCSDEHGQFVALATYLAAHTRLTYDGIAGDVLSQSAFLTPELLTRFNRHDARAVAEYILDTCGTTGLEAALRQLLPPRLYGEVSRERAIARLEREIRRHDHAPNPIASFFFWNRTRREIALSPFGLMRALTVYAPYLDAAVYDFLSSLPVSLLMDRTLHTDAIARAFPHVSHIPYAAHTGMHKDRNAARRLALSVLRAISGPSAATVVQRSALVPRLAATVVDGSVERLWHATLTLYLTQLEETIAGPGAPCNVPGAKGFLPPVAESV